MKPTFMPCEKRFFPLHVVLCRTSQPMGRHFSPTYIQPIHMLRTYLQLIWATPTQWLSTPLRVCVGLHGNISTPLSHNHACLTGCIEMFKDSDLVFHCIARLPPTLTLVQTTKLRSFPTTQLTLIMLRYSITSVHHPGLRFCCVPFCPYCCTLLLNERPD